MIHALFTSTLRGLEFAHPWVLWAGLPVVAALTMAWFLFKRRRHHPVARVSSTAGLERFQSRRRILVDALPILRALAFALLVVAIARPQQTMSEEDVTTYGIDIVLSIDVSASMLARDFDPDRLNVAKRVASDFVDGRTADRIGLVTFAGESFTQCPITTDHAVVKSQIDAIENGLLEDGTAIGMGIATGVDRLRASDAVSRVIILLTDGENNAGLIDPELATEVATQFDVRIYTIGVGSMGTAPMPMQYADGTTRIQEVEVRIDEDLLKDVAAQTGGRYFRATDGEALEAIFEEIDELERTEIVSTQIVRTSERFYLFAFLALLLILLEAAMRYTVADVLS